MPDRAELLRRKRERAVVDRRHRGRRALGGSQQTARPPVREPEHERDAERPDERRGEDGVDRAHVRDDRCPAEAGQLARERRLEPRSAKQPCARRGTCGRGSSPGARPRPRASASTTTSSTSSASARIFGTVAASAGCARVDLLRDEDELRHQKKSKSPSVKCHAPARSSMRTPSWSGLPMKRSCLFVGAKPARRSARRCSVAGGRSSTSASAPPSTSRDCPRDERADSRAVLRRRDEVGEEARRDAVLERVADDARRPRARRRGTRRNSGSRAGSRGSAS